MLWKDVHEEGRSALWEADALDGRKFEILDNKQYTFSDTKGYLLFETTADMIYDRKGLPVFGMGLFAALGVPPSAVFESIGEAQMVAEIVIKPA